MAKKSSSAKQIVVLVFLAVLICVGMLFSAVGAIRARFFPTPTPFAASLPQTAATSSSWWEVYFTDPTHINNPDDLSGSIPEILIDYINQAQTSIHIAAFEFDLTPVADALIAAHQRGVDVRWVTDDEHGLEADEDPGRGQFAMLENAGIEVRSDDRGALMHDKFWIFDGKTVWTGSDNITVSANFKQNNNVIVLHSPEIAAMFEREFQEMWNGEFGPRSPSTVDEQSAVIEGTPVQVLFASEDDVIAHLLPYIEAAQTSIRFMAFSFTEDALGEAMRERAAKGVDVAGIFEKVGSDTQYSEMIPFWCANIPVRQDGNPSFMHHKVIIVDAETVITGSLNFSDSADTSNDENVVVLQNERIAAKYLEEFNRLWKDAAPPSLDANVCP
jgi:phosphatidylserine/phosphatidylglycerophosphate/cardiolipin synthase-like enzyme